MIKWKKTCNKNCLCKQKSRTGQLHWGSLPYKEALKSMLLKLVPKLKRTEYYQIHSMTPLSPWYQSQTKTLQKKKNNKPISLMNIDTKILKILANWIQYTLKGLNTMIKWDLFQGCKGISIFKNHPMWANWRIKITRLPQ